MKNPFKKNGSLSLLQRIEQWLADHQLGVLLGIVVIILGVGLTVSQHPTFWLGQITSPGQSLTVLPTSALNGIAYEIQDDIVIAQSISKTQVQDILNSYNSPLNVAGSTDRIEEVFTENNVTWIMKADAIDPQNQYYDLSFGLYEAIDQSHVEKISEAKFTIDVTSKWQFLALLRNQETSYIQLQPLPFQIEAVAEPATLDIVGTPTFLNAEAPSFLNVVFESSDDPEMYGTVTVTLTNQ